MHICILTADYTAKPVLSGHSRKETNYGLMQVKSIAECPKANTAKRDEFTGPTALESDRPYFEIMGQ